MLSAIGQVWYNYQISLFVFLSSSPQITFIHLLTRILSTSPNFRDRTFKSVIDCTHNFILRPENPDQKQLRYKSNTILGHMYWGHEFNNVTEIHEPPCLLQHYIKCSCYGITLYIDQHTDEWTKCCIIHMHSEALVSHEGHYVFC